MTVHAMTKQIQTLIMSTMLRVLRQFG